MVLCLPGMCDHWFVFAPKPSPIHLLSLLEIVKTRVNTLNSLKSLLLITYMCKYDRQSLLTIANVCIEKIILWFCTSRRGMIVNLVI